MTSAYEAFQRLRRSSGHADARTLWQAVTSAREERDALRVELRTAKADAWDEGRAQAISLAKDEHMHRSHGCCRETLEDLWEDLAAMPNTYRCEEESTDD